MQNNDDPPSTSNSADRSEITSFERPQGGEECARSIGEMQLELLTEELDEMRAEVARLRSLLNGKSQPLKRVSSIARKSAAPPTLRGLILRLRGIFLSPETKRRIKILQLSPHFDRTWYAETYSDVGNSLMTPEEHFIQLGAMEGRDPSPGFSVDSFYSEHPHAKRAGYDPITFITDRNVT